MPYLSDKSHYQLSYYFAHNYKWQKMYSFSSLFNFMTHIAPYLASSHSNAFGTFISITIQCCFIWKIPSKVRSVMNCQKTSFSHFKMLKSDSMLAVLAKALPNLQQNICNAPKQSAPKASHPLLKNVVWFWLLMIVWVWGSHRYAL